MPCMNQANNLKFRVQRYEFSGNQTKSRTAIKQYGFWFDVINFLELYTECKHNGTCSK